MSYFPNVNAACWFAERVLPLIWESIPEVRFLIVGTQPAPQVEALADIDKSIVVTGHVASIAS